MVNNLSEHEGDETAHLQQNDQWLLLPPNPAEVLPSEKQGKQILVFFMPWIAEEDISPQLLATCHALAANPPDWPGIKLGFVQKPSPGFVLRIVKGWEPANSTQEQNLFQKIMWEIQRMERS